MSRCGGGSVNISTGEVLYWDGYTVNGKCVREIKLPYFPLSSEQFVESGCGDSYREFGIYDVDSHVASHVYEWLICIETYKTFRSSRIEEWTLIYQDVETCIYRFQERVILAFRGTKRPKDLYDDLRLSMGSVFPRVTEAIPYLQELLRLNPGLDLVLTGHSLGGAIAREVARRFHLRSVTFNAAAPPSAPVTVPIQSVNYHIVFDFISAWQGPGVVRIDKGYRPYANILGYFLPFVWFQSILDGVVPAHELRNFSNRLNGVVVTSNTEDKVIRNWYLLLGQKERFYVSLLLTGMNLWGMTSYIGGLPALR